MSAPKKQLDRERFQKVNALILGGATPGERMAARAQATRLATAAGMTFDQAQASLRKPATTPTFVDTLNDFFNKPEFVAERAKREEKRRETCTQLLKQYGSEDAVFAETPREVALHEAAKPFIQGDQTLAGWDFGLDKMPAPVRDALSGAWPLPTTVVDAWREYREQDQLSGDRAAFNPDYSPPRWIYAREHILEHLLDTITVVTVDDMMARFDWMIAMEDRDFRRGLETLNLMKTLRNDVRRLVGAPV